MATGIVISAEALKDEINDTTELKVQLRNGPRYTLDDGATVVVPNSGFEVTSEVGTVYKFTLVGFGKRDTVPKLRLGEKEEAQLRGFMGKSWPLLTDPHKQEICRIARKYGMEPLLKKAKAERLSGAGRLEAINKSIVGFTKQDSGDSQMSEDLMRSLGLNV